MRVTFKQKIKPENLEKNLKNYLWNEYGNYIVIHKTKFSSKATRWELKIVDLNQTSDFELYEEKYFRLVDEMNTKNVSRIIHQFIAIQIGLWMKNKFNAKISEVKNMENIKFFEFFKIQYVSYKYMKTTEDQIYEALSSVPSNVLNLVGLSPEIFEAFSVITS